MTLRKHQRNQKCYLKRKSLKIEFPKGLYSKQFSLSSVTTYKNKQRRGFSAKT